MASGLLTRGTLDSAYLNGRIWRGEKRAPYTDAIGISGGRIAAVGASAVRALMVPGTRVVDLAGAHVVPGFMDNHTHFTEGSLMLVRIPLLEAATPRQFIDMIAAGARALPKGAWLQAFGWDAERWGGELPTAAWVDAHTADVPIALTRTDGHQIFANSLALRLAGIDRNTPDPAGGVIVRDAKGEPTGILRDNAQDLVRRLIPPASHAEIDAAIRLGIKKGLSRGVTQAHGTDLDWQTFHAMRRLHQAGDRNMRFYSMVPLEDWAKLAAIIKQEGRGDDWLRWGGTKVLTDGALGSRTALMRHGYANEPQNHGIAIHAFEKVQEWVAGADSAGLQVACHAIGDQAIGRVLDIYAEVARKNGARDRRFRIEHVQHLAEDEVPRFAKQGVIASMQPYHAIDDGRWAAGPLGPERLHLSWALRSLLDAKACVTLGSDWPVAPLDPLVGIHAAVLRQTTDGKNPNGFVPEQKISVAEALTAYTRANAYAGFQEERLGSIVPGKLADFVVLSEDLLAVDPSKIDKIGVVRTVVGGEDRFTA
ncbi:MAG: amidohydrolase [Sphingomonadales bacterium]|nr:MAG: amidohydrolase [Sphingomonadales bacterium]